MWASMSGGYELGLTPDAAQIRRWARTGASKTSSRRSRACSSSAPQPRTDIQDVGEGIRVADVLDPWGNVFGIIENPNFKRCL